MIAILVEHENWEVQRAELSNAGNRSQLAPLNEFIPFETRLPR